MTQHIMYVYIYVMTNQRRNTTVISQECDVFTHSVCVMGGSFSLKAIMKLKTSPQKKKKGISGGKLI